MNNLAHIRWTYLPWHNNKLPIPLGWRQFCHAQSTHGTIKLQSDITLNHFLKLLQWLCIVLMQDCTLLQAQHSYWLIFGFTSFMFTSFTAFSANAASLVTASKENAWLIFHDLPDHLAWRMHRYATHLQDEAGTEQHQDLWWVLGLSEQNMCFKLMLGTSKGSKYKTPGESCGLIWIPNRQWQWLIVLATHYSVMLPPSTVPSQTASALPSVTPPACVVTNLFGCSVMLPPPTVPLPTASTFPGSCPTCMHSLWLSWLSHIILISPCSHKQCLLCAIWSHCVCNVSISLCCLAATSKLVDIKYCSAGYITSCHNPISSAAASTRWQQEVNSVEGTTRQVWGGVHMEAWEQYDTNWMPLYHFLQVTHVCDIWTDWPTGLLTGFELDSQANPDQGYHY